jgi:NAD(P)-dependent dehydrogenase (short-subunit alcohol dehydrogenase family)
MPSESRFAVSRRFFLQASILSAVFPQAWAQDPCRGPQPGPDGTYPRSTFGETSTAEEVTVGLDLSGMTAVVTGCNSGLGYETMRVLTMRGAHVIGTARTAEKAERACSSIDGQTTPVVLELSDFDSVRAGAQTIKDTKLPIDILMCNAGIMALPQLELNYGLERQFVVNHLGHFIFVNGLVEQVKQAQQGRIVMLSSCAHFMAPKVGIDFDNLDGSKSYTPWSAYGRSKLANGLFAAELSRRLGDTRVTANSLHPGVIKTNLGRHMNEGKTEPTDDSVFNKSTPEGAATQCYVAANPIPAHITGQYFSDCNPAMASPLMYDPALASRLWSVSEELTST